tara:strand:- start:130 stop:408 length:279 start_codon:yes stop_codon:yes gene_type:complete
MTVLEMMERAGTKETNLAIAWIKDAIHLIQSNANERTKVVKYNVIDGERDYLLPQDLVAIKSISIKDTNDKKYKKIRRIVQDLIIKEDTEPE